MITLQFKDNIQLQWITIRLNVIVIRYGSRFHRLGGKPARQVFFRDGKKKSIEYWEYGELHRLNKPAFIRYFESGPKWYEEYYECGVCTWQLHYTIRLENYN